MAHLNWVLLRLMYLASPVLFVAGLAFLIQGRFDYAVLMFVIALVLFLGGRRTHGQHQSPFR